MFRVYEKGLFYCEDTKTDLTEVEFVDDDCSYAIMARDGVVGIVVYDGYHEYIHWIENDEDYKYRVER